MNSQSQQQTTSKQTSNESKLGQMSVDMSAIGMIHDHYEDNDTISNYFARSK